MNKNAKLKFRRQVNRNIHNSLTLIYQTSTHKGKDNYRLNQQLNNVDFNFDAEDPRSEIDLNNYNSESGSVLSSNSTSETESETINDEKIQDQIIQWSLDHNINHIATGDLLKILNKHPCFNHLPSDPRTLLKTERLVTIEKVFPGEYVTFDWITTLQKYMETQHSTDIIYLQFNCDGIPIYKSSAKQFWPILCSVAGHNKIFTVGIYCGKSKPYNVDTYLQHFVKTCDHLIKNGIVVHSTVVPVALKALICDAPARSFITGIKNHTGYFGCGKCTTKGTYVENRVTFPEINADIRSDESFRNQSQPEHHNQQTILRNLPLDLVDGLPYEYMHLICLGVTRKIIHLWSTTKKSRTRLRPHDIEEVNKRLLTCSKFTPCEFARKQRSLKELEYWKATELRQFLIYSGVISLKGILPNELYIHYLCLSIGTTILLKEKFYKTYNKYASELFLYFVKQFGILYGNQHISYNVHGVIHLAADSLRHGTLDSFSAFKFENHLQKIKKLVRSPNRPLEQVHKRLIEQERASIPSQNNKIFGLKGGNPETGQYTKYYTASYILKKSIADNCILFNDGSIGLIECFEKTSGIIVVYKKFSQKQSLFVKPCDSALLDIFYVNELKPELYKSPVSSILTKFYKIPYNRGFAVFPLIHV